MKCIRCGNDAKYSERSNGACPKCNGRFAFEPKKGDLLTDSAFENAINAVSAKGQLRWGAEHLYYEIARRQRVKIGCAIVGLIVFAIATLVCFAIARYPFAVLAALIAIFFAYSIRRAKTQRFVRLDQKVFDRMLIAWQKVHGNPKGMIVRAHARGSPAPVPRKLEADIADYSFDRAVICDRARTTDILLANNFHFENNCAVLSADGYPEAHFETIRAMLKRNPRLRVFALHDATPNGCRLAHKLATDHAWFAQDVTVSDVGLRPRQAKAFIGLYKPHTGAAVPAGHGVSAWEATWLSSQELELAVIRPEQVLKRLYKALNRDLESDNDSGGGGSDSSSSGSNSRVVDDTESFTYEASDIESDADGFG